MQEQTLIPFGFWLQHRSRPVEAGGGSGISEPDMTTRRQRDAVPAKASVGAAALSGAGPDRPESCHAADPAAVALGTPPSLSALQQAVSDHLAALGHPDAEPLRWAITGIDAQRGLRLEGIGLHRKTAAVGLPGDPAITMASPRPQAPGNASPGEGH